MKFFPILPYFFMIFQEKHGFLPERTCNFAIFMVQLLVFMKISRTAAVRRQVLSINLKETSTHALAYLGDAVIELRVRERLVKSGISGSGELNKASLAYVKAGKQALAMRRLVPLLSEEEAAVYKRGRNLSGGNVPKSATMSEYRAATGMEVLFGYLYLDGQEARIVQLFEAAYPEDMTEES